MAITTNAECQAYKATSYTASTWTPAQWTEARENAEGFVISEITSKGYGQIAPSSTDIESIKLVIFMLVLDELGASRQTSANLRSEAIRRLRSIKVARNQTLNRLRDDGDSSFGRGSSNTDRGVARVIFK